MMCLPDGLMPPIRTMLLCEWANRGSPPPPTTCADPAVDLWVGTLAADGVTPPTQPVLDALCHFCQRLRLAGIFDKLLHINPLAYDPALSAAENLAIAAYVFKPAGFVDHFNGIVPADYDINGVHGDLSGTKWVETEISPSSFFGKDSAGLTVYAFASTTGAEFDAGVQDPDTGGNLLLSACENFVPDSALFNYSDLGFGTQVSAILPGGPTPGFFSGNRTTLTYADLSRGDSATYPNAVLLGTSNVDNSFSGLPDKLVFWLCRNDGFNPAYFSAKTLSHVAIHHGLDELNFGEVSAYFRAVQLLRMELGGGFV